MRVEGSSEETLLTVTLSLVFVTWNRAFSGAAGAVRMGIKVLAWCKPSLLSGCYKLLRGLHMYSFIFNHYSITM